MLEELKETLLSLSRKLRYNKKAAYLAGGALGLLILLLLIMRQTDIGTKEAATELATLTNNIRRAYQNRPDFWGLSTKTVIEKKIYPQAMLQKDSLKGFFGNDILVGKGADAQVLMPGARNFDIIYSKLNEKQCVELASFKFDEKFWLGITGISIDNGKQSQYFTWNNAKHALPITKNAARTSCGRTNLVIWHNE